jgi:AcrR family transcriptional regulator
MKDEKRYHHGDLREALLTAAQVELEETGLEGFSLRKVAKRAGVSHAAPAHHFGDTTGLLTALAVRGYELFVQSMQAAEQGEDDKIIGAALGYIAFAQAHPALFRLIFSSARPDYTNPELDSAAPQSFLHLTDLLEARTGLCAFENQDAMTDALGVWSLAHGLADLLTGGRMKPLQAMPPEARKQVIIGLLHRFLPNLTRQD